MTQFSSHFISSFNYTVELSVTGSDRFHEALRSEPFWHEFIPDFSYSRITHPIETWHITEAETLSYDIQNQTIRSTLDTIKRIIVIIEASFEVMRQKQAHYTIHGSVIVRNKKAIALIGNLSGIGKTTLAVHAAQCGWTWIADEKFTLLNGVVVGTTRGILNDEKTRLSAQSIIPQATTDRYPLALICQPLITHEEYASRFDLTADKALWVLYDEMTRDIRQVNGIISPKLPVLQSFDTISIAEVRLKVAEELTQTVPISFIRGHQVHILRELEAILLSDG